MEIAGAGPHAGVKAGHGFEVVVEHVRARRDDYLQRAGFSQKVRGQDFNRRARAMGADRLDRPREMRRAAVGKIVAVDRRDDCLLYTSRCV